MAHNFSNLGKIHSCLNFIAWYYWIIKHNYFLKLEWGFPAPFPALPSRLQRQRGKGRGSQYFAWAQAHVALFLLDCIIGPCRQRLISHCEFPTKVAWVLGGWGVEPEEKLLPGATWSPPMAVREATWGKFKEQGLWKCTDWVWAELFTSHVPWGWWSTLQASVCSSVKQGYTTLLAMVRETIGLKSLLSKQPLGC